MKRIVFESFVIAVDLYVSFTSYGKFKDVWSLVFSNKNRSSGQGESPLTREGDKEAGGSAFTEQLGSTDSELAIKLRT